MTTPSTIDMPAALGHLKRADAKLAGLIRQHGPPPFRRSRNYFRTLATTIIYQQLSGKAAGTIHDRFVALFPNGRFPKPGDVLAVPHETLRSVGLSNQKARYLHDLALKFADGAIQPRRFNRMSDVELGQALMQAKGIGQWSSDMFLMFGLCRPDVLPVGDLGIRKGFQQFFRLETLPEEGEMVRLAEPWRPHRTVASWYMWQVADTELPN
ncbi:MAG: DNA-3-methyladenine glycosylase family protein [Gammaproteobacteria bacterium]